MSEEEKFDIVENWKPVEPNWEDLERQMQLKATGANVHRLKGKFFALKQRWELGETIDCWTRERKEFFEEGLAEFYKCLRGG